MKKVIMTGFVAAAALSISVAQASDSVDIPLEGVLAQSCTIDAYLDEPFDSIDMASNAQQGDESLTVNCNYGGTASVTFASANAGKMESASESVPYTFFLSGSDYSGGVSLANSQTLTNFPTQPNTNHTRSMSIQLDQVATIAGTYSDTITASVVPN